VTPGVVVGGCAKHHDAKGRKHENVPSYNHLARPHKCAGSKVEEVHGSLLRYKVQRHTLRRSDTALAAVLRHFLLQRLALRVCCLHNVVYAVDRLAVFKGLGHLREHSLQLVRKPLMTLAMTTT
jgi:hypothetical protein